MSSNTLTPFTYGNTQVRVLSIDGEPFFVLNDLCQVLGIGNSRMVAERLEKDCVSQTDVIDSVGRQRKTNIVSESGMYEVVLRSDSPTAKPFRRWVTHEVLPAIRKTGMYRTAPQIPDMSMLPAEHLAYFRYIGEALKATAEHAAKNQTKADGYDQFLNGTGCYLIDTAANLLGIKHKQLWNWLYDQKILIRSGSRRRQPYANPKTKAWFATKTYSTDKTNGHAATTTYLTPAGLEAIRLLLIDQGLIQSQLIALPALMGVES